MSESPAIHVPIDPKEKPILDKVLHIRDALTLLKSDRSTYIKSKDVLDYQDQLIEQVDQLNSVRDAGHKELEQNRVDYVLDDCFQLVSLLFLTIGRNEEAPAAYAETSTLKRLLDHLKEVGFYSQKDLQGIERRIAAMRDSIARGQDNYSPHLLTLLKHRLDACELILKDLMAKISDLPPKLAPTWEKLVSILRQTSAANTRKTFPASDVKALREQTERIESKTVNGQFVAEDGTVFEHQAAVQDLLMRCLIWTGLVLARQGKIDPRFQVKYDRLCAIRNDLEKLHLTQAWSLRETDLYKFQRELDRFDEMRVEGEFLDEENGKSGDLHTQRTLLYLLRRSYAYIYELIIESEPVSEALLPIYNQLQTLRRCLEQVQQAGGVSSPRELYPYSMKLNSIDNLRVDGKFKVGDDIPEGQGAVSILLGECFDMAYKLRVAAETEDGEEEDD